MMNYHVTLTELLTLEGKLHLPPIDVLEKVVEFHLLPLNLIRDRIEHPLFVGSCYRSREHELLKGRSGTSQHTFKMKGAVDVNTNGNRQKLLEVAQMALQVGYMRVAYYPEEEFLHLDYAATEKQCFISMNGEWQWVSISKLLETINK
jgi:hypothetical protein